MSAGTRVDPGNGQNGSDFQDPGTRFVNYNLLFIFTANFRKVATCQEKHKIFQNHAKKTNNELQNHPIPSKIILISIIY